MIYVGKHDTLKNIKNYLGSGLYLKRAIKKYGKENFKRITLENVTEKTWRERERYWIKKLDSRNIKIGYNISRGGEGGNLIGTENTFYGKSHSKKQKAIWSANRKNTRLGKENTFYGKKHTNKSKENNRNKHFCIKIKIYEHEYPSITYASKKIGKSKTFIYARLKDTNNKDFTFI